MTKKIPLDWYFSEEMCSIEKNLLFSMPQYRGHISMVPRKDDYRALSLTGNTELLIHNENGIEILSNLCRHRQAIMLTGQGNQKSIVCPAHCWRYNTQGQLVNAPYFKENPNLPLKKISHTSWNGLLFSSHEDVASHIDSIYLNERMDFSSYAFHASETQTCDYNWKTFIETYLEIYHVKLIHPGLRQYIDCDYISWEFGALYSSQMVRPHASWQTKSGSDIHQQWQDLLVELQQGKELAFGAEWMMYYPNTMIEHYPHALVVSIVSPESPDRCFNHIDFYHPKELIESNHPYCKAFQDAYLETATEDDVICKKMDQGRKACKGDAAAETGPFQSPLEDGIAHFHQYWIKAVENSLNRGPYILPRDSCSHDGGISLGIAV